MLFLLLFSPVHTNDVEYSTLLPTLVLYLTPKGLIYALGKNGPCFLAVTYTSQFWLVGHFLLLFQFSC